MPQDENLIIKEYKVGTSNISSKSIIAEEIANLIEANASLASKFMNTFRFNHGGQTDAIKWYLNGEDKLHTVLLYGSTGSGKTACALGIILYILLNNPGATGLVSRATVTEIEDTIMPSLEEFHTNYSIPYKLKRINSMPTFEYPNGSKLLCRSSVKARKSGQGMADSLASLQISVAYMNEADSQHKEYFETLPSRMRQRHIVKKPLILCDCNPPSEDHWLYEKFFSKKRDDDAVKAFYLPVQENSKYVGEEYINDLKETYKNTPSLYRKFVEGKFGPTVAGTPVFNGVFDRNLHVSKEHLVYNPELPMQRSWDFGFRRPAVVIAQDDPYNNRINVFYASMGNQEFLSTFADRILRYCDSKFPDAIWNDYCDPSGVQRKSTGPSDITVLNQLEIRPQFKKTKISYGLDIIKNNLMVLSDNIDKLPVLQFDYEYAALLIDGLEFGYAYDKKKNSQFEPIKDGYFEHTVDAFRYMMIFLRRMDTRFKSKTRDDWRLHETTKNGKYIGYSNMEEFLKYHKSSSQKVPVMTSAFEGRK